MKLNGSAQMKFLISIISVVALTLGMAMVIYQLGWIYKVIDHPLGFEIYMAARHAFGIVGPEGAETLVLCLTLLLSLIASVLFVWVASNAEGQMKRVLMLILKSLVILVLSLFVARLIYCAGWYYDSAGNPLRFRLY